MLLIKYQEANFIESLKMSFSMSEMSGYANFHKILNIICVVE